MEINGLSQGRQVSLDRNITVSQEVTTTSDNIAEKKCGELGNESKEVNPKEAQKAIDKLNKFLDGEGSHAEYSFHDKLKHDIMIKIVDDKTGQVIQEIPPKKILDMIAKMCEMVGIIFDKKA